MIPKDRQSQGPGPVGANVLIWKERTGWEATLTRETLRIRVLLALVRQHASTRRKVARGLKMQMSPHLPKTGTDVPFQPRSSSGTQDSNSGKLRTTFRLSALQLQR